MVCLKEDVTNERLLRIAAGLGLAVFALGVGGCQMQMTHHVTGVYAGNGGSTSDLVMFDNSPVDGEQDEASYQAGRFALASRRNAALGDTSGADYVPLGWWDQPRLQIDRPYWVRTSREADTWIIPRPSSRRESEPYWVR